ncbi:hypothetical protein [Parachlamydia sp. AcF125]|uniref:hypothetical protein n=1 Tax=Parachlamydia sp. AcF125 TaxID=2795736 RepID=UPI001BC8D3F9|nr:hypothetical protein [Parachlamydia sp. AcF125]
MDIVSFTSSLLRKIAGENLTEAAIKEKNRRGLGNSIVSLIEEGKGRFLFHMLEALHNKEEEDERGKSTSSSSTLKISALIANIGSVGIGGIVLKAVIGLIKRVLNKP